MLVKFEQKLCGPNYTKFWAFWQKNQVLKKYFRQSVDAILEDVSVAKKIV